MSTEPSRPPPAPEFAQAQPAHVSRVARRHAEKRSRSPGPLLAVAAAVTALAGVAVFTVDSLRDHTPGPRSRDVAAVTTAPATAPTNTPKVTGAAVADPQRVTAFLAGAASDLAAVTSYDYRHLDDALSVGLSVTTGAFRASYQRALGGEVATDARKHHAVQTFELLNAGIGTVSADGSRAGVLVFGRQTRHDDSTGDAGRSVLVTLTATIERVRDAYLISALDAAGTNTGLPPGSPDLTYAAESARATVVDMLNLSRSHFARDERRALAGAVDPLRAQLKASAKTARAALVIGGYDLTGSVTAIAVERAQGSSAVLLVAATGYRVGDDGARHAVTDGRYEVSVVLDQGRWAAADVHPVGSS